MRGYLQGKGLLKSRWLTKCDTCDVIQKCAGSLTGLIWCLFLGFCVSTLGPVLIQSFEVWLKNIEISSNPELSFYLPCESHEDSCPFWRRFSLKETATKSVFSTLFLSEIHVFFKIYWICIELSSCEQF